MACEWEPLAGDTRGTVTSLAPGSHVVYATTPVGVYHSADMGRSWTLTGAGASVAFGESVAASGNAVFVGAPGGLHGSTDTGQTWRLVLGGSRVTAVSVAAGVVLAGTDTDGVLRSEDAGHTWSGANAGLLDLEVLAVALSPGFASDGLGFAGTGSGLYRTRNRAGSWRIVDIGLDDAAMQCVAIGPGRLVVAGTEAHGLVCSQDAGTTWEAPPDLDGRSVTAVAISRRGTVNAATDAGVFVSPDRGQNWRLQSTGPTGVLSLVYLDDEILLAATERTGVWRSVDGGGSWTASSEGLHATLLSALAASADRTVWAAGPTEGVRVWRDGAWRERNAGLPDTTVLGLSIAADGSVFAATPHGLYLTNRASREWQLAFPGPVRAVSAADVVICLTDKVLASDDMGSTWRTLDTPFRASHVVSLVADATMVLVAARGKEETVVWRSTNAGREWDRLWVAAHRREVMPLAIADDTVFIGSEHEVVRPGLARTAPFEGSVTALASMGGTVWVGTTNGVYVSRDQGESYQVWAESTGPRRIIALVAAAGAVYALEPGGRVWRTGPGSV